MEFLKDILGEDLYKQVSDTVNAYNGKPENKDKQVKLADLGSGQYVDKGKYDTAVAEKENLAGQIKTLNTTIGVDKEGKPIGVEEVVKPYKDDAAMAHLFKQEQQKPPYNPKDGGAGGVTNPFAKDTFNLTEQGRMLKENPAQAKELAAAAGVTL